MTKIGVVDGDTGRDMEAFDDSGVIERVDLNFAQLAEIFGMLEKSCDSLEEGVENLLGFFFPGALFQWEEVEARSINEEDAEVERNGAKFSMINYRPSIYFIVGDKKVRLMFSQQDGNDRARARLALARVCCEHFYNNWQKEQKVKEEWLETVCQLQQALNRERNANLNLQENSRSVAALLHNLNNRVTPVLAMAEMNQLQRQGVDGRELMEIESEVVTGCIEDYRAMVGLAMRMLLREDGALKPVMKTFPAARLLKALLERFGRRDYVKIEFGGEALEQMLELDLSLVMQVMENLIGNAFKYGHPQGVPLRIRIRRDGAQMMVEVIDSGMGLEGAQQDKLFDFGYRADGQKDVPGYGIGLYFCRQVMEAMGGTIRAAGNVDCPGSTFTVSFPCVEIVR